jgi:hypothetical protein
MPATKFPIANGKFTSSFYEHVEWRLSEMQAALSAGGSSPAVEALLTSLLASTQLIQQQTDTIELTSDNISLNADQINLNTDQVEALLTTIDAHIVALQAQVGNTAALETRLTEVRDQVIASVATTDGLEALSAAGNAKLDTLIAQTDNLEPAVANQITLTTAGNAKLDTLIAQTDGVEGGLAAINTSIGVSNADLGGILIANQAIQAQTDQVEPLLTTIDAHIVALQAQVGNTSGLAALLTELRDYLVGVAANTTALQALSASQDGWLQIIGQEIGGSVGNGGVISGMISGRLINIFGELATQGADIAVMRPALVSSLATLQAIQSTFGLDLIDIRQVLADLLLKSNQIYGTATNSESALNGLVSLNQQIYDTLKPLVFSRSKLFDVNGIAPTAPLAWGGDPNCRKRTILNDTGDSSSGGANPVNGQCWLFGSYRDANVSDDDFDFVIDPGELYVCDLPNVDFWLAGVAQTIPQGRFLVVEYI